MIEIVDSEYTSPHLPMLNDWFSAEWGEDDFFKPTRDGHEIPAPLVALQGDVLVGGLAFSRFKNPENSEDVAIWVNAVLVPDEFRGQSIASQLVSAAQKTAVGFGTTQLFALTNVEQLYIKQGWKIVDTEGDDKVVMWQQS